MKPDLTPIEQIEYYLGKDKFKDKFFKPEFPFAYQDIHSAHLTPEKLKSTRLHINSWYKDIPFDFNNLGYRSHFDFNLDDIERMMSIIDDSYNNLDNIDSV